MPQQFMVDDDLAELRRIAFDGRKIRLVVLHDARAMANLVVRHF